MTSRLGLLWMVLLAACGEPREAGICYCDFFSGEEQQYDLRDLDSEEQIQECETHDANAAAFGGECELG